MFLDLFQPHLCLTQENFTLQCSRTHLPILLIFYFSLPFSSYLTISPYLLFFSYSYTYLPILLIFSFSLPFSSYLTISSFPPISPSPPLFSSYFTISPSSPLSSSFSPPSNPLSTCSSNPSRFPTSSPSRLFPHHPLLFLLPAVHR